MIKNTLEVIIIMMIATILNFNKKLLLAEEKIDIFSESVESSISYSLEDDVFLIFNYEYLNSLVDLTFEDYEALIEKESESSFRLVVIVKESFLYKEIRLNVYLRKGDMYA